MTTLGRTCKRSTKRSLGLSKFTQLQNVICSSRWLGYARESNSISQETSQTAQMKNDISGWICLKGTFRCEDLKDWLTNLLLSFLSSKQTKMKLIIKLFLMLSMFPDWEKTIYHREKKHGEKISKMSSKPSNKLVIQVRFLKFTKALN